MVDAMLKADVDDTQFIQLQHVHPTVLTLHIILFFLTTPSRYLNRVGFFLIWLRRANCVAKSGGVAKRGRKAQNSAPQLEGRLNDAPP